MHLRNSDQGAREGEKQQQYAKLIKMGQILLISLSSLGLLAFTIEAIISSQRSENEGTPFLRRQELYLEIQAYIFLILFILMAIVNIALLLQIRKMNKKVSS